MRLFIALNFDDTTKERMAAIQNRLRQIAVHGNFSRWDNLHMTLVFLGEVAPSRTMDVKEAMDGVEMQPLKLTFENAGRFHRERGDIWWIGTARNAALLRIQQELTNRLQNAGFRLDCKKFMPHMTIAREVVLRGTPDTDFFYPEPFTAQVGRMSLMQSERIQGVLTYTELYTH